MKILKEISVHWKDPRFIKNLHPGQTVNVRVDGEKSRSGTLGRGVSQRCLLLPVLFEIQVEVMMVEVLSDMEEAVTVGGHIINSVRFADDEAPVVSTENGLQKMMDGINTTEESYSLKINKKKTKTMRIARKEGNGMNITIANRRIEEVKQFKYLGSIITNRGESNKEIRNRIAMGKETFEKQKRLLIGKLKLNLKKRLTKSLIWSVALYQSEIWTIKAAEKKLLESSEMRIWRKTMRVSCREHKRNEEVLQQVDENRPLRSDRRSGLNMSCELKD